MLSILAKYTDHVRILGPVRCVNARFIEQNIKWQLSQ